MNRTPRKDDPAAFITIVSCFVTAILMAALCASIFLVCLSQAQAAESGKTPLSSLEQTGPNTPVAGALKDAKNTKIQDALAPLLADLEALLKELKKMRFENGKVDNGKAMIQKNQDKIKGNTVDGDFARDFFMQMQFDNGEMTPHGNGTDFYVKVIDREMTNLKDRLADSKLSAQDKKDYGNELGMLQTIKGADKDGNGSVSATEINTLLDQNKNELPIQPNPEPISK
jgi:hypothetical protein